MGMPHLNAISVRNKFEEDNEADSTLIALAPIMPSQAIQDLIDRIDEETVNKNSSSSDDARQSNVEGTNITDFPLDEAQIRALTKIRKALRIELNHRSRARTHK